MNYFEGCTTEEEAKSRYRNLAMIHHPDRGGEVEKMQEINHAYKAKLVQLTNREFDPYEFNTWRDVSDVEDILRSKSDQWMKEMNEWMDEMDGDFFKF